MPRSSLIEQQPAHPPNLMYDNPATFQVEDFFNLDMLAPQNDDLLPSASSSFSASAAQSHSSGALSTSSRASSEARTDSPSGSFAHLQTPPEPESIPEFDMSGFGMGMNVDMSAFGGLPPIEEESMFTFHNSEYFKPGTDPLAGLSHAPFDLFGSFDSGLGAATSSSNSNTSSAPASNNPTTTSSSSLPFSIDPQLVGTPAPSASTNSPSDVGAEPDSDSDEARELVVAPVKVGGKGKARRGTLHSGGVSKKPAPPGPQSIFGDSPSPAVAKSTTKASASKEKSSAMKDKDLDNEDMKDDMDADDWRPSPEEYQKMSSKEKRQLRNKISARNFRVRRKEYIHTLEGDIADRDRLIDAIRAELGSTKSENSALRQEVAALKKAILAGRASPMLPPPAPLSPLSPLSSFASLPATSATSSSATSSSNTSASSNASNSIIKPNTHKDLPTSPRLAATAGSAFWGGQAGFGGFGGITPVHTTIIPETASAVFGGSNANADKENENMNPALNGVAPSMQSQQQAISQVLAQLYGNNNANGVNNGNASGAFDSFTDVNPFTLKTLDAYRMQLWSRVAMQAQAQRARTSYPSPSPSSSPKSSPHSSPSPGSPGLQGLASSLRPQYFASSGSPTSPTAGVGAKPPFGALLSGKGLPYSYHGHGHGHGAHGLPSPPPSPRVGEKERTQGRRTQAQAAAQAQREQAQTHALLATLASQTVLQKMGSAFWDAFSGSGSSVASSTPGAGPSSGGAGPKAWDAEKVRRVLEGTAVLRVVDVERPTPASCAAAGADALEECMRSLSLGAAKSEKKEDEEKEKKGGLFARMNYGGCSKQ